RHHVYATKIHRLQTCCIQAGIVAPALSRLCETENRAVPTTPSPPDTACHPDDPEHDTACPTTHKAPNSGTDQARLSVHRTGRAGRCPTGRDDLERRDRSGRSEERRLLSAV